MTEATDSSRRRFIRTTVGTTILAASPIAISGCSFAAVPSSAVSAWKPDNEWDDIRRLVLSYAILAPNPHNRQPWLADLQTDKQIGIRIDTDRLLPDTDPYGRQILIGTGAMVEILTIAAAHFGYRAQIEWFADQPFGQVIDSREVARIHLEKNSEPGDDRLFEQITQRRTVRDPFDPTRPPAPGFAATLDQSSAGLRMGIVERATSADQASRIAALAKQAWAIEIKTPHTMLESTRLLRIGSAQIDQYRDGISITDPMLVVLDKLGMVSRTQPPAPDSSVATGLIDEFNDTIDSTPAFFWLVTNGNTRRDQVRAGGAYVRAQLAASADRLFMHPISQCLQEYTEMREPYQQIHRELTQQSGQTVQMLCRLGYLPAQASVPGPSPRRGLNALLTGAQI